MYNPLKYNSIEGLIGTIETDRVALGETTGSGTTAVTKYLQYGGTWGSNLVPGVTHTWSALLDADALALEIAKLTGKNITATTTALYAWADKMFLQSEFESVKDFADYLITEGFAVVYNYTPEEKPEPEEPEEPDNGGNDGDE